MSRRRARAVEFCRGRAPTLKVSWSFDYEEIFGDDDFYCGDDDCRVRQVVDVHAQLNSAEDGLRRSRCRGVLIMTKFLAMMIFIAAMIGGCGELPTCTRSEILMGTVVTLKAQGKNSQAAVDESFNKIFEPEKNISLEKFYRRIKG